MDVSLHYVKTSGEAIRVHTTGRWKTKEVDGIAHLLLEVYTESVEWTGWRRKQCNWWQRPTFAVERVALPLPKINREKWWAHEDSLSVVCSTVNTCGDA